MGSVLRLKKIDEDGCLPEFECLSEIEVVRIVKGSLESFPVFNHYVFPYSFKIWEGNRGVEESERWFNPPPECYVPCPHTDRWAHELQHNKLTARLCSRKHLKSTTFYSHVMWKLWKSLKESFEGLYISYKEDMGGYHTGNCKKLIRRNPFFEDVYEISNAATILDYSWTSDAKYRFSVIPAGILGFKRGRHPRIVYCDDILADPQNPMNTGTVDAITNTFFEDVMSLPQEGGELHLAGTPQTENDLFFQIQKRGRVKSESNPGGFLWKREPAVINWVEKKVVWPQLFSFERLMDIRDEILEKAFNKEYMCSPISAENAYFRRSDLEELVKLGQSIGCSEPVNQLNTDNDVVAGWDLGKKAHPSHFTVFELVGNIAVQRYQTFWDGVDYNVQLGRVKRWKERLCIDEVGFDATRGEFELEMERGTLPSWMEPIKFSTKMNQAIATELERRVKGKTMTLLNDQRQINVMLQVNNELKATETSEGHGDSFWSAGMAMWLMAQPRDANPTVFIDLGDD